MRKLTTRYPNKSKQKITLAFDKLEPEVIANQLTYLEWKTLRRINVIINSYQYLNDSQFVLIIGLLKLVFGLQGICNQRKHTKQSAIRAFDTIVQRFVTVDSVYGFE